MWTSSELRPKKHGVSLGFQCIVANDGGGDEGCEPDDNCENPGALPPFPEWEGVLATEIGNQVEQMVMISRVRLQIGRSDLLHQNQQLRCQILKYF